jgi:hypothetical protein
VKSIKHDRYFPQILERLNPHENYPHRRGGLLSKFLSCAADLRARHLDELLLLLLKLYLHTVFSSGFNMQQTKLDKLQK